MEQVFILVLVGLTSGGAYALGAKGLGLSGSDTRRAFGKMLECVGMTLAFFVGNLVVGVIIVLAARILTQRFMSFYFADKTLLVLSFLQGLSVQWWRQLSPSRRRGEV